MPQRPDPIPATVPVPTPGQLHWQRTGMGVFFHFGLNTFHGLEWSDGTLDPATFDPDQLDADQWVRTAKRAGAGYVVLTAKHHDGFCLWPTATTDYSVRSAPWRGGRGDVVAEVAEACRHHDLGLGLYLSPWDRNAVCYPDPAAYDAFYLTQLEELCSNYGDLFELWFDGAGSQGRTYDWQRIAALVERRQPQAMVFNMGRPTIRWIGNEDGLAADPVVYVVSDTKLDNYTTVTVDLAERLYLPPVRPPPDRSAHVTGTRRASRFRRRGRDRPCAAVRRPDRRTDGEFSPDLHRRRDRACRRMHDRVAPPARVRAGPHHRAADPGPSGRRCHRGARAVLGHRLPDWTQHDAATASGLPSFH